jgi:hypothetical protein
MVRRVNYERCAGGAFVGPEEIAETFLHVEGGATKTARACIGAVGKDRSLEHNKHFLRFPEIGYISSMLTYRSDIHDVTVEVSQAFLRKDQSAKDYIDGWLHTISKAAPFEAVPRQPFHRGQEGIAGQFRPYIP